MGRGSGKVWTKLKSATTGKVVEHTFQSGHNITEVRVERRKFQYLYPEDGGYQLMNQETYDQISVPEEMIDNGKFLKEGDVVDVLFHAQKEMLLSVELPQNRRAQNHLCRTGPARRYRYQHPQTATVETGAEVRVPLFCEEGDLDQN